MLTQSIKSLTLAKSLVELIRRDGKVVGLKLSDDFDTYLDPVFNGFCVKTRSKLFLLE